MASLEAGRRWREKNPNYGRAYYIKNKEKFIAHDRSPEARERKRANARACYQRNKDRYNAVSMERYRNNKERFNELAKIRSRTLSGRYSQLKARAKAGGIDLKITFGQFELLAVKSCYYCGRSLFGTTGSGLDRVDSGGCYEVSNVVPCCYSCNRIKGADLTMEETKAAVEAIKSVRMTRMVGDFIE